MAGACLRSRRELESVSLMAVSKTFTATQIGEAYAAGMRLFGESKVQEFAQKRESLPKSPDAQWHMIGHLQSNKAAKAVELFDAIDSLDSLRLAEKLNSAAVQLRKTLPVLIEINVGGESAKSGMAPDSEELQAILTSAANWSNLEIRGLMTVPPFTENPKDSRPFFCMLRELRDQIAARHLPAVSMGILSMGMSHDFEVAIEEGATCVRVGTAIFGERTKNEIH